MVLFFFWDDGEWFGGPGPLVGDGHEVFGDGAVRQNQEAMRAGGVGNAG